MAHATHAFYLTLLRHRGELKCDICAVGSESGDGDIHRINIMVVELYTGKILRRLGRLRCSVLQNMSCAPDRTEIQHAGAFFFFLFCTTHRPDNLLVGGTVDQRSTTFTDMTFAAGWCDGDKRGAARRWV